MTDATNTTKDIPPADAQIQTSEPPLLAGILASLLKNKILMGILIVGMLGIFVGGLTMKDETRSERASTTTANEQANPRETESATSPSQNEQNGLKPDLAADFVKWWSSGAMDYSPNSAKANHEAAFRWMTPEASNSFQSCFWTPEIANGIATGHVVAAFQPVAVQAEAVNPDGSVVVGLTGSLVIQTTGQPVTQQIATDFLVRQEKSGLRVIRLYNRSVTSPNPGSL